MTILPCPHCGKTTEDKDPKTKEAAVVATHYSASKTSVVKCNHCGMSGPLYMIHALAIKAWNKLPRR